jgi:hypothetical protein
LHAWCDTFCYYGMISQYRKFSVSERNLNIAAYNL